MLMAASLPLATITRPSIVNNGGIDGGGAPATPPLPASLVTGNLLVAFVQVNGGSKVFATGSGWTIGSQAAINGSLSTCWLYRFIDGAEAAPSVSFTGGTWHGEVFQLRNVKASSPIGNTSFGIDAGAGTALAVSTVATSAESSMLLAMLFTLSSQVIPLPANYTSAAAFNDGFGSDRIAYETKLLKGATSDDPSVTIASSNWAGYLIEILGK